MISVVITALPDSRKGYIDSASRWEKCQSHKTGKWDGRPNHLGKIQLAPSPFALESVGRGAISARLHFMLSHKAWVFWGHCYHEKWTILIFFPLLIAPIPGRFCRPFWLNQARSLSITNIPWPVPEDHLHFTSGHPLPPDWSPSPHLLWHLRRTRWVFCYYPRGLSPSQTEAFELESLDNRELLRVLGWLIWYRCLRMETGTALSQPWNREGRRAWARRRQRIWGSASTGRIFLKEDSTYIRQGPDLWQGFPPLGQWCF